VPGAVHPRLSARRSEGERGDGPSLQCRCSTRWRSARPVVSCRSPWVRRLPASDGLPVGPDRQHRENDPENEIGRPVRPTPRGDQPDHPPGGQAQAERHVTAGQQHHGDDNPERCAWCDVPRLEHVAAGGDVETSMPMTADGQHPASASRRRCDLGRASRSASQRQSPHDRPRSTTSPLPSPVSGSR
jgi:hypothetical protein